MLVPGSSGRDLAERSERWLSFAGCSAAAPLQPGWVRLWSLSQLLWGFVRASVLF